VPLAVKTNQRRPPVAISLRKKKGLQKTRSRGKRAIERIWARVFTGRKFHKRGPAEAKAHC